MCTLVSAPGPPEKNRARFKHARICVQRVPPRSTGKSPPFVCTPPRHGSLPSEYDQCKRSSSARIDVRGGLQRETDVFTFFSHSYYDELNGRGRRELYWLHPKDVLRGRGGYGRLSAAGVDDRCGGEEEGGRKQQNKMGITDRRSRIAMMDLICFTVNLSSRNSRREFADNRAALSLRMPVSYDSPTVSPIIELYRGLRMLGLCAVPVEGWKKNSTGRYRDGLVSRRPFTVVDG
ncbi:hypothetical protein DFH08DRAFT_816040 [Mycena albidolilacea]|uniref:Uncharacterized protein n=1 Tax=Mycena albidolilacea TaxID=1033008 RepID=A0AAD7EJT6_9AGAR|nr:hypothetical protein DFH08DRAFT_816040 [Mycena albidolilacea]